MVPRQLPTQLVHEARLVGADRRQREAENQVGHVVRTVLRDREEQEREAPPRVVGQPPEQPEVEQRQPAVVGQEDVPAMRVGVVDAGDRDLMNVGAEERPREVDGALLGEAVVRVELAPVDPFEDQHALADVRAHDLRHDEVLELRDEARDQLRVVGLVTEVQLRAQVDIELVGQRPDLKQLCSLGPPFEERSRRTQDVEVEFDLLHDARPAHLHDDLAAAREQRGVDLRDRRGGERLGVDACEHALAEVFADHRLEVGEGHRRDLVDQLRELLGVDVGKEVGPRREELPELHVRRPELLERASKLARSLARGGPLADDADLAEDAEEPAAARYPTDVQRALRALEPGTHRGIMSACFPRRR